MKNQVFYEELVLKVVYMSFAVLSMHGFLWRTKVQSEVSVLDTLKSLIVLF